MSLDRGNRNSDILVLFGNNSGGILYTPCLREESGLNEIFLTDIILFEAPTIIRIKKKPFYLLEDGLTLVTSFKFEEKLFELLGFL